MAAPPTDLNNRDDLGPGTGLQGDGQKKEIKRRREASSSISQDKESNKVVIFIKMPSVPPTHPFSPNCIIKK